MDLETFSFSLNLLTNTFTNSPFFLQPIQAARHRQFNPHIIGWRASFCALAIDEIL